MAVADREHVVRRMRDRIDHLKLSVSNAQNATLQAEQESRANHQRLSTEIRRLEALVLERTTERDRARLSADGREKQNVRLRELLGKWVEREQLTDLQRLVFESHAEATQSPSWLQTSVQVRTWGAPPAPTNTEAKG